MNTFRVFRHNGVLFVWCLLGDDAKANGGVSGTLKLEGKKKHQATIYLGIVLKHPSLIKPFKMVPR